MVKVTIGEFSPFTDGVEAAELSGSDVERCCAILATRPPFRDSEEAATLNFKDGMHAREIARIASGAMAVALETGRQDYFVRLAVFNRTGALALRLTDDFDALEAIDLISLLGNGDEVLPCRAHVVHVV